MYSDRGGVIPSPNIWHWPHLYEAENRAQDPDGAIFGAMRSAVDWAGGTVVDVGCGAGFHLPTFASDASKVVGVEPHEPLLSLARRRTVTMSNIEVRAGRAEALPLADASVDLVHARTAYFFGPGCGPGIVEAMRVLERGGALVVVDLDATATPYGDWMRADLPNYDPAAVEEFFAAQGFQLTRVDSTWRFPDRATLQQVLGIEFSPRIARRAARVVQGLTIDVRYRMHVRHKPSGFEAV